MDDLIRQYEDLMSRSDYGDAFPGSKAWRTAQPYAVQLRELIAAHPEIEPERARRAQVARDARLAGVDLLGV